MSAAKAGCGPGCARIFKHLSLNSHFLLPIGIVSLVSSLAYVLQTTLFVGDYSRWSFNLLFLLVAAGAAHRTIYPIVTKRLGMRRDGAWIPIPEVAVERLSTQEIERLEKVANSSAAALIEEEEREKLKLQSNTTGKKSRR